MIVDEAALRRQVGGEQVMREQCRLLLEMAELPNITLQLLPFSAGQHRSQGTSFTLLRMEEPDVVVVYSEDLTRADYLKGTHVQHYSAVHSSLADGALSDAATLSFIAAIIKEGE